MRPTPLSVAYMPLLDAAPLIVAKELGFAEAEGVDLQLVSAPSWSSVRDMLAFGQVSAAHLLSPVPVAMALGLGGVTTPLAAASVLSMNGTVLGVSTEIAARMRAQGLAFDFGDPVAAGAALAHAIDGRIVIGVPFSFSMHVELLQHWWQGTALRDVPMDVRTVPPPKMAAALAAGEVDAFCVGEPWGSVAVDLGVGAFLLPGSSIWPGAPEKVLAVRQDWAEHSPELLGRLMRAVWRAGHWLDQPEGRTTAGTLLSRPEYLGVPNEILDRGLTGALTLSPDGEQRRVPSFLRFHDGAVAFPWRSQSKLIAKRLAARHGVTDPASIAAAGQVFRSDFCRQHIAQGGIDLPGASEKLEGAIRHPTAVASARGTLSLRPDAFFDGYIFDPDPSKAHNI